MSQPHVISALTDKRAEFEHHQAHIPRLGVSYDMLVEKLNAIGEDKITTRKYQNQSRHF
jgi:DNA-binding HxlR family transcriptional regulator